MIVEISQLIAMIEDFMIREDQYSMDIGGCVGTGLFRLTLDTVTQFYDFHHILVIEGCQDFVEMMKQRLPNHIFYGEAVYTELDDFFMKRDRELPEFMRSDYNYKTIAKDFNNYDMIIINDAHLIPEPILQMIHDKFYHKIISLVDPFDYDSEKWMYVPTVVDSLSKLSMIQAFARKLYNIETRAIDKNILCGFKDVGNVSIRSVGKQDKHQYVTPSADIIDMVNSRRKMYLHRGQKIICRNRFIEVLTGEDKMDHIFTNNTLGVLTSNKMFANGMYNVKLHNSKHDVNCDLTMDIDESKHYKSFVEPANIISIDTMRYHKFNSIQLVLPVDSEHGITIREFYSVLRNTNNLTIGHLKMKVG